MLLKILFRSIPFFILIPLIIGVTKRNVLDATQKRLFTLTTFYFIFETFFLITSILHVNNIKYFAPIMAVEISFIYKIFSNSIQDRNLKSLYKYICFLGICFIITNAIYIQGTGTINSFSTITRDVIIILSVLLSYYYLLQDLKEKNLEKSPVFWIGAALLLYNSSTMIIFALGNIINMQNQAIASSIWIINVFLNILKYLIFGISLWITPEKQNFSPSY
ncbi:hypothetical protein PEDI_19150 [Persicobacter diffluens]|uniref:Uncharacterized protein n=1 Tax=Persicobacter diffluens TaxID=981 RepID=A0AAN5ALY7_9BACT|nr:hypothetical protein PEDI_19150 [Persicobacter diffluens]